MGTYLSRTPSSEGNRKTFTFSTWVKRSKMAGQQTILLGYNGNNNLGYNALVFKTNSQLALGGWSFDWLVSTAIFRDPSAWYHIVLAVNTPDSTANDRIKLYVNGTQLTDFGTRNNPSQNDDFAINDDVEHNIGSRSAYNSSDYLDGYLAECYMIDGQALAPTSFGQTDSTTGIWKPKTYSGSYGTNGFRLEFKNAGALGTDTSGNTNTWTVNNAGTGAQVTDTPSNVFSVLNAITADGGTWTLGALKYVTNGTDLVCGISSFTLTGSSKWYCEMKAITKTGNYFNFGVASSSKSMNDNGIIYRSDGKIYKDGNENQGSLATFTDNDIIGIIYDCNNNQCSFQKNGSAVGSAVTIGDATKDIFFVTGGNGGTNATAEVNFGNPVFSISSSNADGAGLGSFEYAVPSGAYSLCTENLNTYG